MNASPQASVALIEAAKLIDREAKPTPLLPFGMCAVSCFAIESLRAALAMLSEADND